jgi:hypothetical protein
MKSNYPLFFLKKKGKKGILGIFVNSGSACKAGENRNFAAALGKAGMLEQPHRPRIRCVPSVSDQVTGLTDSFTSKHHYDHFADQKLNDLEGEVHFLVWRPTYSILLFLLDKMF